MKTQRIEKKLNVVVDNSNKSVDIFTKLISDLELANSDLDTVIVSAKEHIEYYTEVLKKAEIQKAENIAVVDKVNGLLNN